MSKPDQNILKEPFSSKDPFFPLRESRIKEALMRAYVAGWQDGHAGSMNDDRKREVAQDLLDWFLT